MAALKQAVNPPPIPRLEDQSWKGDYMMIIEKLYLREIRHSLKSTAFEFYKVYGT